MSLQPITLTGHQVTLEPLSVGHSADLTLAGQHKAIWTYMRYGQVDTVEKMSSFILHLLELQTRGTDLPFAVVHHTSGRAIGMTRYMNIEPENRSLEIGGTWYGIEYQRTGVNTECKFLLLQHAFEGLACIRVQFKTDSRNERSLKAIARIGAVQEGVLRNHMILPDGTFRSSVYFSILAGEWLTVKQRLIELINKNE